MNEAAATSQAKTPPPAWVIEPLADDDQAAFESVIDLLRDYNAPFLGRTTMQRFRLAVLDAQRRIVGGLLGEFRSHWLHIDILVLHASLRGSGTGRALMQQAEGAARERGCHGIWLDTFDFQAPAFYEHLGYTRFGTIENFHDGHARTFYEKRL